MKSTETMKSIRIEAKDLAVAQELIDKGYAKDLNVLVSKSLNNTFKNFQTEKKFAEELIKAGCARNLSDIMQKGILHNTRKEQACSDKEVFDRWTMCNLKACDYYGDETGNHIGVAQMTSDLFNAGYGKKK